MKKVRDNQRIRICGKTFNDNFYINLKIDQGRKRQMTGELVNCELVKF